MESAETKKIKDLKKKILNILKEFPETRNSDIALTIKVWKEYCPTKIIYSQKYDDDFIRLKDLFVLPREDNIKRIRANIQSPKIKGGMELYPPTSEEVARQRGFNMDDWHRVMAWGIK